MNVLDYSIKLGELLRKTEEGKSLLQLQANIKEKYEGNTDFGQYEQFADGKTSKYYFYSWDIAYKTFTNVLTDDSIEHRDVFVPTAELISADEGIKTFATEAVSFGDIFERIVAVSVSGGQYEKVIPATWKYKVKNAVSDVRIAVERTLLMRTIAAFYQKHQDLLNNAATQKYLIAREEKHLLPFSQKAFEMMSEAKDVSQEEKILYEKMYLVIEAVKKGIFYGFWGRLNEISKDELLTDDELYTSPLQEVMLSCKNNCPSKGWLYKIQLEDGYVFFMAHKRQVQFSRNDTKSTISGIVYPADDRRLFEKDEY